MSHVEADIIQRLTEIFAYQPVFEEKSQELTGQVTELSRQIQDLKFQLQAVNAQDKKSPITINNNIMVIQFQVNLLRRMVLTLDINERLNLNKLILGCALLFYGNADSNHAADPLFNNLKTYRGQLAEKIITDSADKKSKVYESAGIGGQIQSLGTMHGTEGIDRLNELNKRASEAAIAQEGLNIHLHRNMRTSNLLDKLFHMADMPSSGVQGSPGILKGGYQKSFGTTSPLLRPLGLTHTPEGEILVVDRDHHRICRFSAKGARQERPW